MKERRRKVLGTALAFVLSATLFAGCGTSTKSENTSSKNATTSITSESTESQNITRSIASGNDVLSSITKVSEDSKIESTSEMISVESKEESIQTQTGNKTYSLSEQTLVDDEHCSFVIKNAEVDKIWGFTLKVLCINKTEDKELMFSIQNAKINGYKVEAFWAEEVAPGKKSNSDIHFSSESFKNIGIDFADELVITLRVYDSNDLMVDELVEESFTLYPTGQNADSVEYPSRRTTEGENVIIDNDQVSFVILENMNDPIWGYTLQCYMENKTDKPLMFSWKDVSVNGFMINPFWATEIQPKTKAYDNISFSKSSLKDNDISSVETISYTLHIYNSSEWQADAILDESYTYKP